MARPRAIENNRRMPPLRWIPSRQTGATFEQPLVALLLDAARRPTLAPAFLRAVNHLAPAAYLSIVRYDPQGPVLLEGHAHAAAPHNITHDCWARYRERFFRVDELPRLAQRLRDGPAPDDVAAMHCTAPQIPDHGWREQIYEQRGLSDRLTLLYAPVRGMACSINLYRTEAMGPFDEAALQRVLSLAPLLKQVHGQVLGATPAHDIDRRIEAAEEALCARTAALSPRERQVCARIACGLSVDGIAADLAVAPSTVLTLRKRAYAKLGLHNRIELARLLH